MYQILGLEKGCSDKDIKAAYRKLALKWHPDRNAESEEQQAKAKKQFQLINEAYNILSDPDKRRQHDMGASAEDIDSGMGGMGGMGGFPGGGMRFNMGGGGMGGIDPNDIMRMFMGMQGGMGGGMGG